MLARICAAALALVMLTGMSNEQAMRRMEGQWQAVAGDGNHTTASAWSFDADLRYFRGMYQTAWYEGTIKAISVVGESVWLTFDNDFSVIVYPGNTPDALLVSIGKNLTLSYRKVD